jgi:hypothetical protein
MPPLDRCSSPLRLPAAGTLYGSGAAFRVGVVEFDGESATIAAALTPPLGSEVTLWIDGRCPGVAMPSVVVGTSAARLRLALRPGLGIGPGELPCSCRVACPGAPAG